MTSDLAEKINAEINDLKNSLSGEGKLTRFVGATFITAVDVLVKKGVSPDTKPDWDIYNEFRNASNGHTRSEYISRDVQEYMRWKNPTKLGYINSQSDEELVSAIHDSLEPIKPLVKAYWELYDVQEQEKLEKGNDPSVEYSVDTPAKNNVPEEEENPA